MFGACTSKPCVYIVVVLGGVEVVIVRGVVGFTCDGQL